MLDRIRANSCHSPDERAERARRAPANSLWIVLVSSQDERKAGAKGAVLSRGADLNLWLSDSVVHLTLGGLFINYDWSRIS